MKLEATGAITHFTHPYVYGGLPRPPIIYFRVPIYCLADQEKGVGKSMLC